MKLAETASCCEWFRKTFGNDALTKISFSLISKQFPVENSSKSKTRLEERIVIRQIYIQLH